MVLLVLVQHRDSLKSRIWSIGEEILCTLPWNSLCLMLSGLNEAVVSSDVADH